MSFRRNACERFVRIDRGFATLRTPYDFLGSLGIHCILWLCAVMLPRCASSAACSSAYAFTYAFRCTLFAACYLVCVTRYAFYVCAGLLSAAYVVMAGFVMYGGTLTLCG